MRLDGEAWRNFFNSFTQEAFRLETLPSYKVDSEKDEFEDFQRTGRLDIPDDDPWLVRIRRFRETGRKVSRVHVITRPLTDYLQYEFAVYRHTVAAGEDVRILDLTGTTNPGLPEQDFWLFDNTAVVRMDYDADGGQLGRELLGDANPTPYIKWKQTALQHAEPFTSYCSRLQM
ncbi:DUF6879 family protein [Nocardia sp. NPDC003482]